MFRSNNLAARVFERQILTPRPGTSVNLVRHFYENLVPSCTIYDIDCPDHSFRKFTDDGQYLVSFSRNHQDLIVYRPTWLSFSCKGEDCDAHSLPQKAKSHEAPTTEGAIEGLPSIEKITFYLVRLEDGVILDEKAFCNDFVNLAQSMGVFLYEDLLCIMSLRYQTIHILQIRDSGNLVYVRNIGIFCREDDELFINSHAQSMGILDKSKPDDSSDRQVANGVLQLQVTQGTSFLSGIKQRLLSFIFCKIWNEEADPTLRVQHLKKKFYFHFQDYVDLIMWKVQFLDRHHLLIKFGSVDGGVARSTDQHPAFFAVYNMETTDIVAFYQNSSEELYSLFEQFYDHFHANSRNSLHTSFISSHSNNIHALDQLWCIKNKANSISQFVKKMMTSLPCTCQSQSPSPYFDLSLFRYDEKLISATVRHRHSTEHPIKFISRRQPNMLKFKIKPGPEAGGSDGRPKRISSFLFHPYLPFALSIQQTYMQPTVVNIHFRR